MSGQYKILLPLEQEVEHLLKFVENMSMGDEDDRDHLESRLMTLHGHISDIEVETLTVLDDAFVDQDLTPSSLNVERLMDRVETTIKWERYEKDDKK